MVLCVEMTHALVHVYLFQIPYLLLTHFPAPLYSLHHEKVCISDRYDDTVYKHHH